MRQFPKPDLFSIINEIILLSSLLKYNTTNIVIFHLYFHLYLEYNYIPQNSQYGDLLYLMQKKINLTENVCEEII